MATIQMRLSTALEQKSWLFHDFCEEQAQAYLGEPRVIQGRDRQTAENTHKLKIDEKHNNAAHYQPPISSRLPTR